MSKPTWDLPKGFEALDAYHAELDAIPTMESAESARLCKLAQAGDLAARNAVVEGNLRLVEWVIARYKGAPLPYEDLVQEGTLGLLRAVQKFNPKRGSFSTCAALWISQHVLRAIDDRARLIRRPAYVEGRLRKARKYAQPATLSAGQLADAERVERVGSLDEQLPFFATRNGAEDNWTYGDLVTDPEPLAEERVADDDEARSLREALGRVLPKRLLAVLTLRYGLDGYTDPLTGKRGRSLEQAAEALGRMSRERVRQLEAKALELLRARLEMDHDGLVVVRALAKRAHGEAA